MSNGLSSFWKFYIFANGYFRPHFPVLQNSEIIVLKAFSSVRPFWRIFFDLMFLTHFSNNGKSSKNVKLTSLLIVELFEEEQSFDMHQQSDVDEGVAVLAEQVRSR